jgi:hypothetical protein
MSNELYLQRAVLDVLASTPAPLMARAIKLVVGARDTDDVRKRLGNLVRAQYVERHHNGDGTLSYSLTDKGRKRSATRPPTPIGDTVYAVLAASAVPLNAADVAAVIGKDFTPRQINGALYGLSTAHRITRTGKLGCWSVGTSSITPPPPTASQSPDSPPGAAAHRHASAVALPEISSAVRLERFDALIDELARELRALARHCLHSTRNST